MADLGLRGDLRTGSGRRRPHCAAAAGPWRGGHGGGRGGGVVEGRSSREFPLGIRGIYRTVFVRSREIWENFGSRERGAPDRSERPPVTRGSPVALAKTGLAGSEVLRHGQPAANRL